MAASDDKGSAGRIGDDMQRAKDNISDAVTSARDDVSTDLRRLSADVASLRDTVAELAKNVAAEVGEAATDIGEDITSVAKDQARPSSPSISAATAMVPAKVNRQASAVSLGRSRLGVCQMGHLGSANGVVVLDALPRR